MSDEPQDRPDEAPEEVDAEVVHDGDEPVVTPGAALAPVPPPTGGTGGEVATLWNTRNPGEIIKQAGDIATALADVIKKQDLSVSLGGKRDHVEIAGWQVCGTFLGVQAMTVATGRVEPRSRFTVRAKRKKWGSIEGKRCIVEETDHEWEVNGWSFEAVAEVRTLDGRLVGRGEATCSREESNWFDSEDSAVKSMAQTRACSRALKQTLGFIVGMAGYSETPKEEMDATGPGPTLSIATADQQAQLNAALNYLIEGETEFGEQAWGAIKAAFDGELYGAACEAVAATVRAYKALREQQAKAEQAQQEHKPADEDKPPEGAPPESSEPS